MAFTHAPRSIYFRVRGRISHLFTFTNQGRTYRRIFTPEEKPGIDFEADFPRKGGTHNGIGRAVSRHDSSHQLVTSKTKSSSFPGGADDPTYRISKLALDKGVFNAGCIFSLGPGLPRLREADLARFTRLTRVGKSADNLGFARRLAI